MSGSNNSSSSSSSSPSPSSLELLNYYFIKLFTDSYSNVSGEPKRGSFTDTSTQGDLTISTTTSPTVSHVILAVKYVYYVERLKTYHRGYNPAAPSPNDIVFWSKQPLPEQIDIRGYTEEIIRLFGNNHKTVENSRKDILNGIKTFYCYCTGGLLARNVGSQDNPTIIIQTGCHGPRAEIEHILAWRTMMAIGGNIAQPSKVQKDSGELDDEVLERLTASNRKSGKSGRANAFAGIKVAEDTGGNDISTQYLQMLLNYEKIIAYYGFDPTSLSSQLNSEDMRNIFLRTWGGNPARALRLIVNMDSLIQNGMWYSVRLWNQIKSNACLFRIVENTATKEIAFGISQSRILHMVDIFCSYLYYMELPSNKILQFRNYESYLQYKYVIEPSRPDRHTMLGRLRQQQTTTFSSTTSRTNAEGTTFRFHYLKGNPNYNINITEQEFNYLYKIFANRPYVDARALMSNNIFYVCKNLLGDLNDYKYDRAFFQTHVEMVENPGDSRSVKGLRKETNRLQQEILATMGAAPGTPKRRTMAVQSSQHAKPESVDPFDGPMSELRLAYQEIYNSLAKRGGGRKRRRKKNKKKTRKKNKKKRKKKTKRRRKRRKTTRIRR